MSAAPPQRQTRTTCPYCGTGCGVSAVVERGTVTVQGDKAHPTNSGRLCVKGAALAETLVPNGRLLYPQMRDPADKAAARVRVSWDAALDTVASRFDAIMSRHGPDAVAWYVSGQLLTEDYYVANKLAKGFAGTANIDTNSRLCMSSAVAGHKRAFGEDIVPVSYEDLENADLLVLVGSNTAWCHPVLYQRIQAARAKRPQMKLVVIDPRRTATTDGADLHLPLQPGSDVALFNGLLSFLHRYDVVDHAFVREHTLGLPHALAVANEAPADIASVAAACGLEHADLVTFFQWFARTERVITAFSMGVNQSSAGTDKVNSIINCHLLTGRIGKPGAGPFSITGQPNAMGGREVGGLANMLAAHMDLEQPTHRARVRRFWNSPAVAERPGLKAVDLFEAIERGQVKAVWIMGTNPVVSLPNADQIKRALARCELVVVSDVMAQTDTTAFADVLLPALAWGEKDGTVTNSERCISRQRAFLPAPGEARPDWWALSEIARRWGFGEQFAYDGPHQIFDEHARLTALDNTEPDQVAGGEARYLNLSGLVGLGADGYDALAPVRWPVTGRPQQDASPVFADGRFFHPDGRARLVATRATLPVQLPDARYGLTLNTGRVRDHWHTMTRTGLSSKLSGHIAEPYVDLHAEDARASGVQPGELAEVSSSWGHVVARVRCSGEMARGQVFVPIHWNDQFASAARVGRVVNPVVDPLSGEPEFKHTPVRVTPYAVRWHGFVLSRRALPLDEMAWWTRVTGQAFERYEIAGREAVSDWPAYARRLLGVDGRDADWLEFEDLSAGSYRVAHLVDDRIESCLFVSRGTDLPAREWLSGLFVKARLDDAERAGLLAARVAGQDDAGPTVCSCHGVGRNRILDAIRQGCDSPDALGARLRCGTNCGSCVPELRRLLEGTLAPA